MDEISKLFNKLNKKEKEVLTGMIKDLVNGSNQSQIKKLQNSDFYRARKGRFRVIFHYEGKEVVIDSVALRSEHGVYKVTSL